MRKGICLTALFPAAMYDCSLLIELLLRIAGQKQFGCAEFYFEGTRQEEEEIRRVLEENDLWAVYLAGYPMKRDRTAISSGSQRERQGAVETCERLYERALRLGARKMLIVSGPSCLETGRNRVIEQTAQSLRELSERTADGETEITLEFFPDKGEPWLAVGDTELVREIYSLTDGGRIGITFDTSHVAQLGENVTESFRKLEKWVRHVHLANSVSLDPGSKWYGDRHPVFTVEKGDFSLESMRRLYWELETGGSLSQVDICSMEVISRCDEEGCFLETSREAAYIWNGGNVCV